MEVGKYGFKGHNSPGLSDVSRNIVLHKGGTIGALFLTVGTDRRVEEGRNDCL